MVWNKETVDALYEDGKYRRTVHKGRAAVMRQRDNEDIIALDTPNGVFYAGQTYATTPAALSYKWSHIVGMYNIFLNRKGRVVSITENTYQKEKYLNENSTLQ